VGGGITAFAMLFTRLLMVHLPPYRSTSSGPSSSAPGRSGLIAQRLQQFSPRAGAGVPVIGRGNGLVLCDALVSPRLVVQQDAHPLPHGRPGAWRKPADAAACKQLWRVALLGNNRRRRGQQLEEPCLRVHSIGYVDIQGYPAPVDQLVAVRPRDARDQPFAPN